MRRAEQYAAEAFMRLGLPDGITLRQTVVLAAIAESEGRSQSELVRATGIDRSTLADMIARMEKRGLILRSTAEDDGRAKAVMLSTAGRGRLEMALPALRAADDALLAAIPADQRRAFRQTLIALAKSVDEPSPETEGAPAKQRPTARRPSPVRKARRSAPKARTGRKAKSR